MNIEQEVKAAMEAALNHLNQELKTLRTGRANPAILDHVVVEVYGTAMPLKSIANITVPEAKQLLITPFDPNNAQMIAKAIEKANLNLQAVVDNNVVRISIPPMDESIRKEMVKQCKKKGEDAKIAIREIRRKYNERGRKEKASGNIAEDEMKRQEKMIQEKTDRFCEEIDKRCRDKEKEIIEI
jgi:ribosome recycling factor